MDFKQVQEMLLSLLPMWNYKIAKPFKQFLENGVSVEMYYCIKTLQWYKEPITMSELGEHTKTSKQQMTQIVNRLVEQELVERIYDPSNRRIIKIKLTDRATEYIEHFLEDDASCFRPLLEQFSPENFTKFQNGLSLMVESLSSISCNCDVKENERDSGK